MKVVKLALMTVCLFDVHASSCFAQGKPERQCNQVYAKIEALYKKVRKLRKEVDSYNEQVTNSFALFSLTRERFQVLGEQIHNLEARFDELGCELPEGKWFYYSITAIGSGFLISNQGKPYTPISIPEDLTSMYKVTSCRRDNTEPGQLMKQDHAQVLGEKRDAKGKLRSKAVFAPHGDGGNEEQYYFFRKSADCLSSYEWVIEKQEENTNRERAESEERIRKYGLGPKQEK